MMDKIRTSGKRKLTNRRVGCVEATLIFGFVAVPSGSEEIIEPGQVGIKFRQRTFSNELILILHFFPKTCRQGKQQHAGVSGQAMNE